MSVQLLDASRYTGIARRGENLDGVRRELNVIVNAQPTQIHPSERSLYLDGILDDLSDREGAVWLKWSEDVHLLALTAVKSLGRNPIGSETLLSERNFSTILYHTALPCSTSSARTLPASTSASAREALKVLANLLVLHPQAREIFAAHGGAGAIARALANKTANGESEDVASVSESDTLERLFLLGRIGFLVTVERPSAVAKMVDDEAAVESLVKHLFALAPTNVTYAALSELLKMTNNILRFYPAQSGGTGSDFDDDNWSQILDPLLYPLICLFHSTPFNDLSPPLSHAIHTLLSIPCIHRLLPTWYAVPTPQPPSPAPATYSSPKASMKTLLSKLGNLSSPSMYTPTGRRSSGDNRAETSQTSSRRGSANSLSETTALPPSTQEPPALPRRLLRVFDQFFETYLPFPAKPDDTLPQGLILDESLPPLLLLLTHGASASEPIRLYLKDTLLPSNLDRTERAGPLESREGTLGNILRLMGCGGHPQCRNTAGELMWAICKGDAADLCVEIGYGNAAGLLFQKGLSGPPPAKIEEVPDEPAVVHKTSTQSQESSAPRNPITALRGDTASSGLEEMTQEEKEREAERLFVLFERMERNPVISMNRETESGKNKKVSIMDLMREKLARGELERDDVAEEEDEDGGDECEAMRDLEAYKRRMGKK